MLQVICFGEALIDMLSSRIAGQQDSEVETFSKFPGGAPANAAVAVARLGGKARFCGMLGDDAFGHFLFQALTEHNVDTRYVSFTQNAKTALAFVSLDNKGERSFVFYRPPAADLCFRQSDYQHSMFNDAGIFHICSNSLTEDAITEATFYGVQQAKAKHWLISFDVNLRHNLWANGKADAARVNSLVVQADVVKMSADEYHYLAQSHRDYLAELRLKVPLLLITDGAAAVRWFCGKLQGEVKPPKTTVVDTTAAGDAFIGGILFQLALQELRPATLVDWLPANVEHLIRFACACGAHAVSIAGAFPSLPTQHSLTRFLS